MKACPNCQSESVETNAVICTECGYNFQTGKVMGGESSDQTPTEYEKHVKKLKGSWLKVGSFLATTVSIIFGAILLYLRASYVEANGGVLILPKPLMVLYYVGGKNLACGFLLISAFLSFMSAVAFLPWNFIEAEWFLGLLYKIAYNFRFAVYSIVALTLLSFVVSAYEYYSSSKELADRGLNIDLVLEINGDYEHASGLQKKDFIENLVNHEKWPELEKVLDSEILFEVNYFESRKVPIYSLTVKYKSKRLKGITGSIGDKKDFKRLNKAVERKFISENKLKLSKELCDKLIEHFIVNYSK